MMGRFALLLGRRNKWIPGWSYWPPVTTNSCVYGHKNCLHCRHCYFIPSDYSACTVQTVANNPPGLHPTASYLEWMRLKLQLTSLKIKETLKHKCSKTRQALCALKLNHCQHAQLRYVIGNCSRTRVVHCDQTWQ